MYQLAVEKEVTTDHLPLTSVMTPAFILGVAGREPFSLPVKHLGKRNSCADES